MPCIAAGKRRADFLREECRCGAIVMLRNVFVKPSAEPNLFRLCRGEKTTVENKRRMKFNLFGKRERKPSADYAGAEKER